MTLFGATSMGYVLIESSHLERWRELFEQGLGLHLAHAGESGLAFRIDGHALRIALRRGPAEDVVAVGWQVHEGAAFRAITSRFEARGIAIETGTDEEARARGVKSFVRVRGPKDLALEFFTEPVRASDPLEMLASGFVTGEGGMGHLAVTSRRPEEMQRFWEEIFDARLSDRVSQPIAGVTLDIAFLRLNERHHSIAIAATRGLRLDPIRTKVQHVNLQVACIGDLERAFTRCRQLGFEMAHEIGQHPNDRQMSFYVRSPSDFEIELGWNALTVDEASWRPETYDAISSWGHGPERASFLQRLTENAKNFARGLQSLLHPEHSPLERSPRP